MKMHRQKASEFRPENKGKSGGVLIKAQSNETIRKGLA